ncbi:ectoine/hydroxyectoine ABC transporter substrate-binding protein EhuB [Pararhodospirillum photometricum]|uniref:Putative extracellular solute-binding protein n=1 Tax=Pararhodospirillum photometricum DSM 122 TaxID=1150469 RepID=H6SPH4_PARPM|nr:ectoine/hydroxyectoine ABC transporter substrate-binding protein EhuB [Pararhodospirillum photometricum]CCG09499.1 Putative extracellular solute-binding protein [Pararhodospirillum photometricum DSM 122]
MRLSRRFWASLAGVGLLVAAIAALFRPPLDPTWERLTRTRVVRVGYAWEPPYAYRDTAGHVTGESPEVARVILTRLGFTSIEWIQTTFASLIPDLQAGRFDLIAAGMFDTPERATQVAFSLPTACVGLALLVKQGNPLGLHSLEDLARTPQARLAVLSGAMEGKMARDAGIPDQRLLGFPDPPLALDALRQGMVDALALTSPTIDTLARATPDTERAHPFLASSKKNGCSAFAFRQEDSIFLNAFNREMDSFIGSSEHVQLVRPFGFARTDLPAPRGEHP